MKKILLLVSFIAASAQLFAQTNYASLKEAKEATEEGYKTSLGWIIKEGDKIQLGKGSAGQKNFAYIYNAPGITLDVSRRPLPPHWQHKNATVKKITFIGNKKSGWTPILVVGVGLLENYHIEVDNAIESGEVIVPAEYKKREAQAPSSGSVADELKKLKELLDSGAITQEEYDAQKKKLLGQ